MSYADIHKGGRVAVTHTRPLRCGDCKLWQPSNPDRWIGWCPKRQARRDHAATACEEGE